ncbi:helix-turn-helix transcriptional regulator [Streptomyces sp. NPDC047315]|uniref:helix-turn-helix transcriptional regulator n=1 Tax=Streptomyces sp. NPDC047315 TaxID=3155142 RepID=UPI0033DA0B87
MPTARLHLTDPDLLRKLMHWAPDGRLTGQDLANRVGVSKQKISALLSGHRATTDLTTAHRIAEVLGVHQGALFFQPLSTPMGVDSHRRESDEHQRALDADAVCGARELGQHPGPREPYRRRPPR